MLRKIRLMGAHSKFSALSSLSLMAVLLLHLVHWLSPVLIGGAVQAHVYSHHHHAGGGSSSGMDLLILALLVFNVISMYFAVRQLAAAWKMRRNSTLHTRLCSGVSLVVLGMGIYTIILI